MSLADVQMSRERQLSYAVYCTQDHLCMLLQGDMHAEVSGLQDEPAGVSIFRRLSGFHIWLPLTPQCVLRLVVSREQCCHSIVVQCANTIFSVVVQSLCNLHSFAIGAKCKCLLDTVWYPRSSQHCHRHHAGHLARTW